MRLGLFTALSYCLCRSRAADAILLQMGLPKSFNGSYSAKVFYVFVVAGMNYSFLSIIFLR